MEDRMSVKQETHTKSRSTSHTLCALALFFAAVSPSYAKPVHEESAPKVTVHYYRYSCDYTGWSLWAWTKGDEKAVAFGAPDSDGFATASVDYAEFNMLVRRSEKENDWVEKDGVRERFIKNVTSRNMEVWILQNDDSIYLEKPEIPSPAVLFAVADAPNIVTLTLIKAPDDYSRFGVFDSAGAKLAGKSEKGGKDDEVVITLAENALDVEKVYTVKDETGAFSPKSVVMRGILDSFFYSGDDLGLTYSVERSVFKVWSPQAVSMSLALFDEPGDYNANGKVTDNSTASLVSMQKDRGVWSTVLTEDLKGKFYLYYAEFADSEKTFVPDPYAKAVSPNGQRMAVVDLSETNPPRWTEEKPPLNAFQDAIIYEVHTRDFSIDEDSGMTHKGKFLAFTETGTKNKEGSPTGIDHLKALGVTHVHLLPSFDFASVNDVGSEQQSTNLFNWGYDPQNYNAPEGSYSTDPWNPITRIVEFKQMVQAFHDAGIRVVMDVVYNHTFQTSGGPFSATQDYFYRTDGTGRLTNGSGCGNEVASERPMVRKFISDSALYWAKEYHVDGFRFDLMGLIDVDTMKTVIEELRTKVDPSVIVYGEPWIADYSPLSPDKRTVIGKQKGLGLAVFNDRFRNAIKGGGDDASHGFASGAPGCEQGVALGVMGSVNDFTTRADESVNYVTAHDNLNLWDKFALAFGAHNLADYPYRLIDSEKDLFENDPVRAALLSNAIVFTSQGVPFFQAGDEFLRSKFGDTNSYSSPDSVNQIRWENASQYKDVVDYYSGLIRLRKEHPAFRMNERADIEKHIAITRDTAPGVVSFLLKDNANGDSWRNIFVVYNGSEQPQIITLPETDAVWVQVVTDKKAGVEPLIEVQEQITTPRFSAAVLYAQ
jgi:pullulanase